MNTTKIPKEQIIFSQPVDEKIYAREQKGWWQNKRRTLNYVLMALFILLPWIEYQGQQAIYFNVGQQTLNFFSLVLFPSDLFIFCLIFMFAAFTLFYVTKFYGRVWCGFACPQTIWTFMFNWVERRIEGSHNKSRRLDQQSWGFEKTSKKVAKHTVWMAISVITALVFMSYFVPVKELYVGFATLEISSTIQAWVWFFAICTYANAGFMKEKMCQHVCPYSRFQSAMFDKFTWLIDYDSQRGESRGKRKMGAEKQQGQGDCVDCDLCVQVCPVGIDIRNGIQYECISCGLCIDACDQTMSKFKYAKNLIGFKQEQTSKKGAARHLAYGFVLSITVLTMVLWAYQRVEFDLTVSRDRQALYRINNDGDIENSYIVKVRNKSREVQTFNVEIPTEQGYKMLGDVQFDVQPGELYIATVAVARADDLESRRVDMPLIVSSLQKNREIQQISSFYGPKS